MNLAESLADVVGARHVLSDSDLKVSYEHDFSGRYSGTARLVVRPCDTQEVAGVLAACASHDVAIVPQGGNTGLVGAGVPRDHEVLLSLLTPFAAFWLPHALGGSGVLATVVAGLYVGSAGVTWIRSNTRLQALFFWDIVNTLITGAIFLLTGLQARTVAAGFDDNALFRMIVEGLVVTAGTAPEVRRRLCGGQRRRSSRPRRPSHHPDTRDGSPWRRGRACSP